MQTINEDIERAEKELAEAQSQLEVPENFSEPEKMQACLAVVAQKQQQVDELYALWEKIEGKLEQ